MYEEFISKRISTLRLQKMVSAREMSLAIGQNGSYINRIENQKALPSMQVFFYICEYLEITPQDFFNEGNINPAKTDALLHELSKLNEEQVDLLLSVAKGLQHGK